MNQNAPALAHTTRDPNAEFAARFLAFGGLVVAVAAIRAIFFGAMGPPPLVVGWAYALSGGNPGVLVVMVSAVHLFIFAVGNAYLCIRVRGGGSLSGVRSGLISAICTGVLFTLSLFYWLAPLTRTRRGVGLGGIQAGLLIQGSTFVWALGIANIAGFLTAGVALIALMRRNAGPAVWLTYNAALHLSLFVFLFPWLGGYD